MMNEINTPILITTAISPPENMPFLTMKNPILRKITSKAAVYNWIGLGFKKIVIADSTDCFLFNETELRELSLLGVYIEQLKYEQNKANIKSRGKGYAEGLLLEFALNETKIIAENQSFLKCTGKVFVRNIHSLMHIIEANNIANIFWRYLGDGAYPQPFADTRFFYCEKSLAMNDLIPAFLMSDDSVSACEYHVFNMLNNKMKPGSRALRPLVTGFSGGTGELYFDNTLGHLDIEFPCWISLR